MTEQMSQDPSEGTAPGAPQPPSPWERLRRTAAPRATKANALAALLAVSLGFAIATQIQQNQSAGLQTLRQDELVRVLDDLGQRSSRLDQQVRDLQAQRDGLSSGANTAAQAAAQAQQRLDQASILAGTVRAQGPGVRLTVTDPARAVKGTTLLDVIQELRDAGAEVIQVGQVRIVASSYVTDAQGTVSVDGQRLERPFFVLAIGDSQTLASALNIPGGVVDTVRRVGASAQVEQQAVVQIDAVHTLVPAQYAQPVPDPAASATTK
ncbi:MAG: DUF881 domain-containing protein [Dermatophilaceae bacterium]